MNSSVVGKRVPNGKGNIKQGIERLESQAAALQELVARMDSVEEIAKKKGREDLLPLAAGLRQSTQAVLEKYFDQQGRIRLQPDQKPAADTSGEDDSS